MTLKETINGVNKAIENAKKLTTKTRKKLPDSVFCGPGRSFPCQDCAHVRAAKVYLNRSRFSLATKKKIAACINRKAKSLGCGVTKPAKAKGVEEKIDKELQAIMDSQTFESTKALVEQSIENNGVELNFDDE